MNPPTLLFLFNIVFPIWGPLQYDINFGITFSISAKKGIGVLREAALGLPIAWAALTS